VLDLSRLNVDEIAKAAKALSDQTDDKLQMADRPQDRQHVVAARLGHAHPAITLRVSAHVLRDQASEVAQVFASVVDLDRPLSARDSTGASNARTSDSNQSPAQGSDLR